VKLGVECKRPVVMHAFVRNMGRAMLPRGVRIGLYMLGTEDAETHLGTVTTSVDLFPGQATSVVFTAPAEAGTSLGADYRARIIVNPDKPRFRECRDDNNASSVVSPACLY